MLELTKNIINEYLTNQIHEEKRIDKVQKNELINKKEKLKKDAEKRSYEKKNIKTKEKFLVDAVAYKKDIQIKAEKTQILDEDNAAGSILDMKK